MKEEKENGYVHCYPDKKLKRLSACKECRHKFVFEGVTRCGYKKDGSSKNR